MSAGPDGGADRPAEAADDGVPGVAVEYCGEWFRPRPGTPFDVGRDADLDVDDNPYLHRRFLRITWDDGMWWLANAGTRLSATVCDMTGGVQSWLPPGARLPLVFPVTAVIFTAGPTTYELAVHLDSSPYRTVGAEDALGGATTIGSVTWTTSQLQLIVALAEPMLRREGVALSRIPSSAQAAQRLGWALTRFNRKLDNVCDKLDRLGVSGLRGGPGAHATNRRARLVEYAVSSRMVTPADLALLERAADTDDDVADARPRPQEA